MSHNMPVVASGFSPYQYGPASLPVSSAQKRSPLARIAYAGHRRPLYRRRNDDCSRHRWWQPASRFRFIAISVRIRRHIASEHEVQALRQAKTYAQSGKNNSMWGVYVPEAIVFAGAFSLRDPAKDETYPLAASIDTSGIDEVTFSPD